MKEEGVWKISRLDYYLETTGPYETGWVTGGRDVKLVPFHYTPAEAGVPIPPIPDDADPSDHRHRQTRSPHSTDASRR